MDLVHLPHSGPYGWRLLFSRFPATVLPRSLHGHFKREDAMSGSSTFVPAPDWEHWDSVVPGSVGFDPSKLEAAVAFANAARTAGVAPRRLGATADFARILDRSDAHALANQ